MTETSFQRVMNQSATARLPSIDSMRLIGMFAVVMIHMSADRNLSYHISRNDVVSQCCRFAVPFFFIAGGYVWNRKPHPSWSRAIRQVVLRTAPVFLFWLAVYLVLIPGSIPTNIDLRTLAFLFAGGPAYHLWFLPAFAISVSAVVLLTHWLRWRDCFVVALMLYGVGLMLGSYAGLVMPWGHSTGAGLAIARGGPFFGPIFVLYGAWLARTGRSVGLGAGLALVLSGAALHLLEAYLLDVHHMTYFVINDFLLGTLAYGAGAFALAMRLPTGNSAIQQAARLGRLTLGIYAVHLLFVIALRSVLRPVSLSERLGVGLLVLAASVAVALVLSRFRMTRPLVA